MRTLVKYSVPVEAGNAAIQNGTLPKVIVDALEELKPEAAYFFTENGLRTSIMVIDMQDSSEIPGVAERFFMGFNATVSFTPVMNADDLKKGLSKGSA